MRYQTQFHLWTAKAPGLPRLISGGNSFTVDRVCTDYLDMMKWDDSPVSCLPFLHSVAAYDTVLLKHITVLPFFQRILENKQNHRLWNISIEPSKAFVLAIFIGPHPRVHLTSDQSSKMCKKRYKIYKFKTKNSHVFKRDQKAVLEWRDLNKPRIWLALCASMIPTQMHTFILRETLSYLIVLLTITNIVPYFSFYVW